MCLFLFLLHAHLAFSQHVIQKQLAPDFVLAAANGESISLAQYKDKVVLVDFWASWCLPCRSANKKLSKKYTALQDENFVIISISVDTDFVAWKKAIRKDKMQWPQLLDNAGIQNNTAARWGARKLPASFLINTRREIVATDAAQLMLKDPKGFKELLNILAIYR